jgi:citrate/tricarballylate utilization protein
VQQPITPLAELIEEGRRQLTICNACRYCEGYCSVWPALERRRELSDGDLTHLANLCHDCRDCLDACMYAAPHEFELNPPKLFSQLRLETYEDSRPHTEASTRRIRVGLALIFAWAGMTLIAVLSKGPGELWTRHDHPASPYSVISYAVLLTAMGIPLVGGSWKPFLPRAGTGAAPTRRFA